MAPLQRSCARSRQQSEHSTPERCVTTKHNQRFHPPPSQSKGRALQRMNDRGDHPVLRLKMSPKFLPDAESANVIAEIKVRKPDEIVLLSGHYVRQDVGRVHTMMAAVASSRGMLSGCQGTRTETTSHHPCCALHQRREWRTWRHSLPRRTSRGDFKTRAGNRIRPRHLSTCRFWLGCSSSGSG